MGNVSKEPNTYLTFQILLNLVYKKHPNLGLSCQKGQFLPCVYKQLKSCIQLHETNTLLYTPRFELLFLEKLHTYWLCFKAQLEHTN